jgi:hypothetical protein
LKFARNGKPHRCLNDNRRRETRTRAEFLKDLRPLPAGLAGSIMVKDLTVDEFPTSRSCAIWQMRTRFERSIVPTTESAARVWMFLSIS